MFLIILKYISPLSEVDRVLPEHRKFLEEHYAEGHFLLSGRQEPRTGGVILATATSRNEVETIISKDPFSIAGVAEYEIIEFIPAMSAAPLASYI